MAIVSHVAIGSLHKAAVCAIASLARRDITARALIAGVSSSLAGLSRVRLQQTVNSKP